MCTENICLHMNDVMNGIIIKTVSKLPVYVVFTNTYQIKTDVLKKILQAYLDSVKRLNSYII